MVGEEKFTGLDPLVKASWGVGEGSPGREGQ
jgi:hypothetical protein